jgi:hypothetical protein
MIVAVLVLLANFAYRKFQEHEEAAPAPVASPAAAASESSYQAPNETLPPATVVTNPEAAAQPAQQAAASTLNSTVPRSASVPPAANRTAPPRPIPREATND